MAPYSLFWFSNQTLESEGVAGGALHQHVKQSKENERKVKKEKARQAYEKMCRGLVTPTRGGALPPHTSSGGGGLMTPPMRVAGGSASSFFPMGPETEVFDLELESANPVFGPAPDRRLSFRGQRTPGPGTKRTPSTQKTRLDAWSSVKLRRKSFKCEEVLEYAVDTYVWKKELQTKYRVNPSDGLDSDIDGEMRHTLLQWTAALARQLELSLETWCLSANYLDRFMAVQLLDKDCLQLAGLTCLLVAAKVEEQTPPEICELLSLCGSAYTRANFRHMEVILLSKLNFQLLAPTPSFLLAHLVQVGGEKDWPHDLSRHMVEMSLCCEEISSFSPLEIAHAIYTVIKGSDPSALASVVQICPICQPAYGDIYSREFVAVCFEDIADNIRKSDL